MNTLYRRMAESASLGLIVPGPAALNSRPRRATSPQASVRTTSEPCAILAATASASALADRAAIALARPGDQPLLIRR